MQSPVAQRYEGVAWGFYAQDQWRVTPKLMLDYGLRWDMFFPPYEEHDRNGTVDPTRPNSAVGGRLGALTFWGDGTGRNGRHYEVAPITRHWDPGWVLPIKLRPKWYYEPFTESTIGPPIRSCSKAAGCRIPAGGQY